MPSGCAPDETIREFLEGTLAGAELEALEAHLDGCEQCGPRLLALARDHHQLSGAAPEGGLLARGSSVGRFVILEVLGRGAYGTVHTAYDPQLDRRLALKVLDAWSLDEPEQLALVQHEARGMARVNHPNVVSIHDAGVVGGVPFVAMEFVAGVSLAKWLEMPRTEQEILQAFHAAGLGLAAVHEAGLVHGDFRADNVLVGDDGRVRVTDFGLASLVRSTPDARPAALTAADDQYAFCLALQRALEQAGYLKGILSRRTRDVLARGLSKEPAARFESLPALLNALQPRRGPLLAAVAVTLVLAAIAVPRALRNECKPDPRPLAGVWDEGTRAEVEQAFSGLRGPFATATFQLVAGELDGWRAHWLSAGQDACVAARDGRDPLLDELRTACLEESRREATVLVAALRKPDGALVTRAHQSVQSLSPLSRCLDTRALLEEPAPSDAARRASMLAHKVEPRRGAQPQRPGQGARGPRQARAAAGGRAHRRFAKNLHDATGGNFDIKFFEPGALVPALECFDAAAKGSVDSCWTTPGYHTGKLGPAAWPSSPRCRSARGSANSWRGSVKAAATSCATRSTPSTA